MAEPTTLLLLRLSRSFDTFRVALAGRDLPGVAAMLHSGNDVLADSPHGQALAGRLAYDAMIFVTGEDQTERLRCLAPLLAGHIDPDGSAAVAGMAHDITAGNGASRVVFSLRRRADMTLERFHAYWFHNHAAGPRERGQPTGYHQLHSDPQTSAAAAEAAGVALADYDGVALFKCAEFESKRAAFQHPATHEALADERRFIDHQRSELGTYHPL